jgi:hypothetical protein
MIKCIIEYDVWGEGPERSVEVEFNAESFKSFLSQHPQAMLVASKETEKIYCLGNNTYLTVIEGVEELPAKSR